jgi:hypothetical protein
MTEEPSAPSVPVPPAPRPPDLYATYTLAVEMADRVSARRGAANQFFLTVQTALLAAVGFADTTLEHVAWYAAVVAAISGCAISGAWWLQLRSYRRLNQAKFRVIGELEQQLPAKVFTQEWDLLHAPPGSWRRGYVELGATERLVPWLLAAWHVMLLLGRLLE